MSKLTIRGRPLAELRVIDLKEELDKRNLSKSGKKSDLMERLEECLRAEGGENENHSQANQNEEVGSDTFSSPNIAMKETGNEMVAEYLRNQQEALQAAKKAKEQAQTGSSDSESDEPTRPESAEKEEERADAGGSGESSPRSTHSSSPRREPVSQADEGANGGSRSRRRENRRQEDDAPETPIQPEEEEDSEEEEEEQNTPDTRKVVAEQEDDESSKEEPVEEPSSMANQRREVERSVEVGETESVADDEVEIAAPPESVEEMMVDQQGTKMEVTANEKEADGLKTEAVAPAKERPPRKRKWGSTRIGKRETLAISSDSLKDIVGSVKDVVEETLPEHKVELDYDDEQPEPKRIVLSQNETEKEEGEEDTGSRESTPKAPSVKRIVVEEPSEQVLIKREEPAESQESTTEEGMIRVEELSPARYEVSEIVHVRCLTRPFTMKGLKGLLKQFGNYDEKTGFWIDNIKSNCVIKYDSKESAEKARNGLHNVKWPPGNPKMLRVDYATEDVLERHLTGKTSVADSREDFHTRKPSLAPENRGERPRSQERVRRRSSPSKAGDAGAKEGEWDRNKGVGRGQSPPKEEQRKGRSTSVQKNGEVEAKPARLLDDLFRKTKHAPCIYWLPLTEDQIRVRTFEKKAMAEEQERQAERRAERIRKMEEEEERFSGRRGERRFPPGRRQYRSPSPERFRRR